MHNILHESKPMSIQESQCNEHIQIPFSVYPTPVRLIGRIPVFEDDIGEFSLVSVKIYFVKTKKIEDIQVKCDASIEAIRNLYELTLRLSTDIKSNKSTENTLGYIVHKKGNNMCVSGDNSLPRTLFGKEYHYARHVSDDPRDLRKSAFKQVK